MGRAVGFVAQPHPQTFTELKECTALAEPHYLPSMTPAKMYSSEGYSPDDFLEERIPADFVAFLDQ